MSNRLDQERERILQPQRIKVAKSEIEKRRLLIIAEDNTKIVFMFKGHPVQFFPYSGWHTGKTIQDGRGLRHLLEQLKVEEIK